MQLNKVSWAFNQLAGLLTIGLCGLIMLSACGPDVSLPTQTPTFSQAISPIVSAPVTPALLTSTPNAFTVTATSSSSEVAVTPQPVASPISTPVPTPLVVNSLPPSLSPDRVKGLKLLGATQALSGHTGAVHKLALSPDGKILASASDDTSIKLWDLKPGEEAASKLRATLIGHMYSVWALAFSPDGKTIASGDKGGFLKFWDVASGKEIKSWNDRDKGLITGLAFSPDGKALASGYDNPIIWVREVATGKELALIKGDSQDGNVSLAYSPDGKLLATSGDTAKIRLLNADSGQVVTTFSTGGAGLLVFSPDGKILATGNGIEATMANLWDVKSGKLLYTLPASDFGKLLLSISFSPDGRTLATGTIDSTIKLWEVATGRELLNSPDTGAGKGEVGRIDDLLYSRDGKTIFAGVDGLGKIGPGILILDGTTLKKIGAFEGQFEGITALTFSPDGKTFASASSTEKSVKIWQVQPGSPKLLTQFPTPVKVTSVAFSPDGATVAAGLFDPLAEKSILVWKVAGGKELATLRGHQDRVNKVAFSPDGKLLASASSDNTIILWDLNSLKAVQQFNDYQPHQGDIALSVAFSPDGQTLAGGFYDRHITLWDVTSGKKKMELHEEDFVLMHSVNLAFSRDGKYLVNGSGYKNEVHVWDLTNGRLIKQFKVNSGENIGLTISSDDQTVFSASGNGTIQLWDLAGSVDKAAFVTDRAITLGVSQLALSPDGKLLLSGHKDNSIKLWQAS